VVAKALLFWGEVVAHYTFTLQLLECFGGLLGNSYAVARVF